MNSDVVLHPATKKAVTDFCQNPAHAVALAGSSGVGKGYLASAMAADILGIELANMSRYPYITRIAPIENSIGIDAIRSTGHFVKQKTAGEGIFKRILIVEHAELMTEEAQNAFLKVLEEPPNDAVIILTVEQLNQVLPTISSRVQVIQVKEAHKSQIEKLFEEAGFQKEEIDKAYKLAGGRPGLLSALLNSEEHPLRDSIVAAKELLSKNKFERLKLVDQFKERSVANSLFEAIELISRAGVFGASTDTQRIKWQSIRKTTFEAKTYLSKTPNMKLLLTNYMLEL